MHHIAFNPDTPNQSRPGRHTASPRRPSEQEPTPEEFPNTHSCSCAHLVVTVHGLEIHGEVLPAPEAPDGQVFLSPLAGAGHFEP